MEKFDICANCGLPVWACEVMTNQRKKARDMESYTKVWEITEALRKARPVRVDPVG